MAWKRVIIETSSLQAEALSEALMECGALSASIEQNLAVAGELEVFGEPGEPVAPLWPHCLVDALLSLEQDEIPLIHQALTQAGIKDSPAWQVDVVADQDWVRLTQSQFDPIEVSPKLWIVPTWHQPPESDAVNIRLDPGQAFGTGSHPTTQLCLRWLAEHPTLSQENLLDYGCGSGILAIAAGLLGATSVVGVDIDPVAVDTACANALRNHVPISFMLPAQLSKDACFDGIVANILAAPLVLLAPLLMQYLKPGGWVALSGILTRQSQMVINAYAAHCRLQVAGESAGWVCLSGFKYAVETSSEQSLV